MAVVATLSKGHDLDYVWRQVGAEVAMDGAGYYIRATENGGEPPGRWWGPGAEDLGFEQGQIVERVPYDWLFGERMAPDGTRLGRPPSGGHAAADLYGQLLAAEPHAILRRKTPTGSGTDSRAGKASSCIQPMGRRRRGCYTRMGGQKRAYKQWLGVQHDWKAVEQLAEARNAVAHGLGTLTRRQRRDETKVKAQLSAVGIKLDEGRIVLSGTIIAAAASVCRDFIEQIDLAVQQRPANFQ